LSLVGSAAPSGRMFLSSLPIRWARSASPRFPPAIVRCASGAGDHRSVGVTTSGAGDPRSVGSHDHPRLLRRDHRSGWVSRSPVCYNLVQLPARECPFNTLYGAVWADTYFREAVLSIEAMNDRMYSFIGGTIGQWLVSSVGTDREHR